MKLEQNTFEFFLIPSTVDISFYLPTKTNLPKSRIKDKIMKYSVGWKNGI